MKKINKNYIYIYIYINAAYFISASLVAMATFLIFIYNNYN